MPGEDHRLKVFQGEDGEWHWHRQAANGEIVASGEGHSRRADAVRAAMDNFPNDVILIDAEPEVITDVD
jgi:uncharacterized protein YegP (UPF0339 family)